MLQQRKNSNFIFVFEYWLKLDHVFYDSSKLLQLKPTEHNHWIIDPTKMPFYTNTQLISAHLIIDETLKRTTDSSWSFTDKLKTQPKHLYLRLMSSCERRRLSSGVYVQIRSELSRLESDSFCVAADNNSHLFISTAHLWHSPSH